jgi:hypothetical protein
MRFKRKWQTGRTWQFLNDLAFINLGVIFPGVLVGRLKEWLKNGVTQVSSRVQVQWD